MTTQGALNLRPVVYMYLCTAKTMEKRWITFFDLESLIKLRNETQFNWPFVSLLCVCLTVFFVCGNGRKRSLAVRVQSSSTNNNNKDTKDNWDVGWMGIETSNEPNWKFRIYIEHTEKKCIIFYSKSPFCMFNVMEIENWRTTIFSMSLCCLCYWIAVRSFLLADGAFRFWNSLYLFQGHEVVMKKYLLNRHLFVFLKKGLAKC
jgi:hypothetical protein